MTVMVTPDRYRFPLANILFPRGVLAPGVSASTTDLVVDAFVRYLLHAQTFRHTLTSIAPLLNDDRTLKAIAKASLRSIIDDPFYTTTYRPALLRAGAGDRTFARTLGLHADVMVMARYNRDVVTAAITRCRHPLHTIGPAHALQQEAAVITRVQQHVSKFAYRRARFLHMGTAATQHEDVVGDLRIMGLRAFRWYYPFRADEIMDNTVRATVTNRGLSYVRHHTRQCRGRMVTDARGITTNMESHDERAVERYVGTRVEERDVHLRLDIERLAGRSDVLGEVAHFVGSASVQESFLAWLGRHSPRTCGACDVAEAVRKSARPYGFLLGKYLKREPEEVLHALNTLRRHVA